MSYTLEGDGQYKYGQSIARNGTDGAFQPFQLWAGESGKTQPGEIIAQFGPLPPYTVMGRRADGKLVPLIPPSDTSTELLAATGTITFSAQPAVGDTVTLNGVAISFEPAAAYATGTITFTAQPAVGDTFTIAGAQFTFIASGADPQANQIPLGNADTDTAASLYDEIFANGAAYGVTPTYTAGTLVINLTAIQEGTAGNAITLAETSAGITISGATLTGGVNAPSANQVALGATDALTAENLAEFIYNNSVELGMTARYQATTAPLVVSLMANVPGTGGNSLTIAKSSTAIAISGATLAGGSNTGSEPVPESRAFGFLATGMDTTAGDAPGPVYITGQPNWLALVWPEGTASLIQARTLAAGATFFPCALK